MKKIDMNLIPDTVNMSPDYYCTWQTQFVTKFSGNELLLILCIKQFQKRYQALPII